VSYLDLVARIRLPDYPHLPCLTEPLTVDRKAIIKSFKGFIHSIAKEQYGSSVLLTLFECVDDTVLLAKSVIAELFKPTKPEENVSELLRDRYASRVVLYLLTGRNKKLQAAHMLAEMAAFDEVRKTTTKKEDSVRAAQNLESAAPLCVAAVLEHMNELVRDKNGADVVFYTLTTCPAATTAPIIASLLDLIKNNVEIPTAEPTSHAFGEKHPIKKLRAEAVRQRQADQGLDMDESLLVNRAATSLIKQMLNNQQEWTKEFASALWKVVKPTYASWLHFCAGNERTSGTCYIFVALFETCTDLHKAMKCAVTADELKIFKGLVKKQSKG
jgi:pumilio homology domain family member 6